MTENQLQQLLDEVQRGAVSAPDAARTIATAMRAAPFDDLGFARVDTHRALRQGFPEVILGLGKTPDQIAAIAGRILASGQSLLVTRAQPEAFQAVRAVAPEAVYHATARAITILRHEVVRDGLVAVVTAGTTDIPVAEEAALTAEVCGANVERVFDVGVAGLHRLLGERARLASANAVIVVAGMEGALPSVVGGLIASPVIAVPTSVGYGAAFEGLAALLGMLNSCASNVAVVNIDNGFGAGFVAALINRKAVAGGQ